ncbi:hypothetical protein QTO34_016901 [Cnephaeus nilssonii]|uniref:Uncharacterized protein n=1 Tax=Cnephaeus nilssonii TaxID=3371016 RepID=A0AA40I368_CNENI|nr:hypothetical protein QTO34_016901 [Eptesicus nilssonii]
MLCSATLCSEETPALSPNKRTRPAQEGGQRLRFAGLSEYATAPSKGSAPAWAAIRAVSTLISTTHGENPCENRHSDGSSFWVLWKSSSTFWLGYKTLQ